MVKMLTSREIHSRIIWDARLNANAFTIGYIDRKAPQGIKEKPLLEWEADGDIPWHRIRYIRCASVKVWDRDQHIDLFSSDQLPAMAWINAPAITPESHISETNIETSAFIAAPVYHLINNRWSAIDLTQYPASEVKERLTIISFNVLSNLHEQDKIETVTRYPAIVKYLGDSQADIIALQEAGQSLLDLLCAADWLRDYFISEPPTGSNLDDYGLLLISKYPFSLVKHHFSAHKNTLVATWQIDKRQLNLSTVHLTSNHTTNAAELRARQLKLLLSYLKALPGDCIIAGDFNIATDEVERSLSQYSFIDLWTTLQKNEPGATFDPGQNSLAAITSSTGQFGRLDRIMFRSENNAQLRQWQPQSIELFGDQPLPDQAKTLFMSDHFGLRATLRSQLIEHDLTKIAPVFTSAIVIIPAHHCWPMIQAIRQQHDLKVNRWMPHITLIYGFLPEQYFAQAATRIATALKSQSPFHISLTEFDHFKHGKSVTVWLRPVAEPHNALIELQAVLQQLFPSCQRKTGDNHNNFTPHLSVGQFENVMVAKKQLPAWQPIDFPVDSIALISRQGDQPFVERYRISLGTGEINEVSTNRDHTVADRNAIQLQQQVQELEPVLTTAQQSARTTVRAILEQACAECLGTTVPLYLLGSARLGVESQWSDLDLLCLIPPTMSGADFLAAVHSKIAGLAEQARVIDDAMVKILKLELEGVSIDLSYAHNPFFPNLPQPLTESVRRRFDDAGWQVLVGCLEIDKLIETVESQIDLNLFRLLVRAVRAWARARQLRGNGWGFPGNFSWSLLAAWSCTNYPNTDLKNISDNLTTAALTTALPKLLINFFSMVTAHDWQQPIALTRAGQEYQHRKERDWLAIVTSIKPCQNSARNLTRSTIEILRQEFLRATKLLKELPVDQIDWRELFAPAQLLTQSKKFLLLKIDCTDRAELARSYGWLEGHITSLIIDLERKLNLFIRPWPLIEKYSDSGFTVLGFNHLNGDEDIDQSDFHNSLTIILDNFVEQFSANFSNSSLSTAIYNEAEMQQKRD